jgi:hypothetical protein
MLTYIVSREVFGALFFNKQIAILQKRRSLFSFSRNRAG